jgi:RNA polymerase sigma factor (sigma-70 family)
MTNTSVSLLSRARDETESDSWRRLASIYTPLLQQWMCRYELQASDADDLVQEVLVTVARELPDFEHSGRTGAFRKWLKTILVHRLQNFWRSRKYRPTVKGGSSLLDQLKELQDDASSASRIWNSEHDRHVLGRLLQQIRKQFEENTWEAFRRQMLGGESPSDVADSLGMAVHSVYVAKSRVLHALRQESAGLVDSFHIAGDGSDRTPQTS